MDEARIDKILKPANNGNPQELPFFKEGVSAGFPSPAEDFIEGSLSIDDLLIKHPNSTYLLRVVGDSMIRAGIYTGDILVVDRSVEPSENAIVIATIDGEFTVKRLKTISGVPCLVAENANYKPFVLKTGMELVIWGVVVGVIRKL